MGKDPAFSFYAADFLVSDFTLFETTEHVGALVLLKCHCWKSGDASLPDDDRKLAVFSGLKEGWFKGGSEVLRPQLVSHPEKDGHLTFLDLWSLWLERQKWRQKSIEGGRKSAKARGLRSGKGGSTTLAKLVEPNGNSSSSSLSSSSPPPPAPSLWSAVEEEEIFEMLTSRGVSAAKDAIVRAKKRGASPAAMHAIVREFDSKPGAWSAGALFRLFSGDLDDWPPVADEHRKQQHRSKSEQSHAAVQVANREAIAKAAQERERMQGLVAKWDSKIKSLTLEQQNELIESECQLSPEARAMLRGNLRQENLAAAAERRWGSVPVAVPFCQVAQTRQPMGLAKAAGAEGRQF